MNKNNDNKGTLIIICIFLLFFLLCGNLSLYWWIAGSTPDGSELDWIGYGFALLAVILDILLIYYLPKIIKDSIKDHNTKLYKNKKDEVIKAYTLGLSKIKYELEDLTLIEKRSKLPSDLISLLLAIDDSENIFYVFEYYNSKENDRLQKAQVELSKKYNYSDNCNLWTAVEFKKYKSDLIKRKKNLQKVITDIQSDLYDIHQLNKLMKIIDNDKSKRFRKLNIKSKCRTILLYLLPFSFIIIITALLLYNSPLYATSKAKENYLNKYIAQDIVNNYMLSDIEIISETFSEFEEVSRHKKKYWLYSFSAKSNDIQSYCTKTENSTKAYELLSVMRKIYTSFENNTYTYNHSNGWQVNIEYNPSQPMIIIDNSGNKYEYWRTTDGFEYLEINGCYVIYYL